MSKLASWLNKLVVKVHHLAASWDESQAPANKSKTSLTSVDFRVRFPKAARNNLLYVHENTEFSWLTIHI